MFACNLYIYIYIWYIIYIIIYIWCFACNIKVYTKRYWLFHVIHTCVHAWVRAFFIDMCTYVLHLYIQQTYTHAWRWFMGRSWLRGSQCSSASGSSLSLVAWSLALSLSLSHTHTHTKSDQNSLLIGFSSTRKTVWVDTYITTSAHDKQCYAQTDTSYLLLATCY